MGLELALASIMVRADASKVAGDVKAATPGIQGAVSGLAGSMSAIASGAMSAAGVMMATGALHQAGQFEQTMVSFEVMLGSVEEAKKTLGSLTKFAAETPFEMPEIEQAARGLVQFGERGDDLMATLKIIGNAASGTSSRFGEIALIFNQVRGVGKLLTEDFRQLSTRGIISLEDIAKHYKVTTAAANKMMTDGKISFKDFRTILDKQSKEGGRFANMMEKQSTTLLGLWSTLTDGINLTKRAIGEGLMPIIKPYVAKTIQAVESIRQWINEHKRLAGGFVAVIVGLTSTISLMVGLKAVAWALVPTLKSVGFAFKFMWKSMLGPVGWIIVAITAAVAGIVLLIRWIYSARSVQEAWSRFTEKLGYAWENLVVIFGIVKKAFNDMMSGFNINLPSLDVIGGWVSAILNVIGDFVVDASDLFRAISMNPEELFRNWPIYVMWLGSYVLDIFRGTVGNLVKLVGWLVSAVVTAMGTLASSIVKLFSSIPRLVKAAMSGGFDVVMNDFKEQFNQHMSNLVRNTPSMPEMASLKPSAATNAIGMASQMAAPKTQSTVNDIRFQRSWGRYMDQMASDIDALDEMEASFVKPPPAAGEALKSILKDATRVSFPDLGKSIQDAILKQGVDNKQEQMLGHMANQDKLQQGILEAGQTTANGVANLNMGLM